MTADTLTPAVAGNGASRLGAPIQAADDPAQVDEEIAGATVDSSPTEAPAVTTAAGSDPARSIGLNDRVLRAEENRRPVLKTFRLAAARRRSAYERGSSDCTVSVILTEIA